MFRTERNGTDEPVVGAILVVGLEPAYGVELRHALEARGNGVIMARTWHDAHAVDGDRILSAVVFDAMSGRDGPGGWEACLRDLRPCLGDITAIGLIAARMVRNGRCRGLHVVRWADPATVASRVHEAIRRQVTGRASKVVLDALHERVLAGDLDAVQAFCVRVFVEVRSQLAAAEPREDPDLIDMAVDDALAKYGSRPPMYDPGLGHPLALFRKMRATRSSISSARAGGKARTR